MAKSRPRKQIIYNVFPLWRAGTLILLYSYITELVNPSSITWSLLPDSQNGALLTKIQRPYESQNDLECGISYARDTEDQAGPQGSLQQAPSASTPSEEHIQYTWATHAAKCFKVIDTKWFTELSVCDMRSRERQGETSTTQSLFQQNMTHGLSQPRTQRSQNWNNVGYKHH